MSAPTQPVQLGTVYAVNFSGAEVPTTAGYMAKDGWKQVNLFATKAQVEDLGFFVVLRVPRCDRGGAIAVLDITALAGAARDLGASQGVD